jgi:hypothetical protein
MKRHRSVKRIPWSRLKSLVELRLAPSLAGRGTLHQARYRHAMHSRTVIISEQPVLP